MSSTGSFCTAAASIDLDMVYSVASFAFSSVVARKLFLVAKKGIERALTHRCVSRCFLFIFFFAFAFFFHHFDDAHVSQ